MPLCQLIQEERCSCNGVCKSCSCAKNKRTCDDRCGCNAKCDNGPKRQVFFYFFIVIILFVLNQTTQHMTAMQTNRTNKAQRALKVAFNA